MENRSLYMVRYSGFSAQMMSWERTLNVVADDFPQAEKYALELVAKEREKHDYVKLDEIARLSDVEVLPQFYTSNVTCNCTT